MKKFTPLGKELEQFIEKLPDVSQLPDEDPDARCPHCDGYGHIIDERGARPCQCVTREVMQDAFAEARIPYRFLQEDLSSFQMRNASSLRRSLNFARQYVKNYSRENCKGIYITGPTGVGKTHLAIGILKALMEKGYTGVFYNLTDLLDDIRATYEPQAASEASARINQYLKRQVLVLDDFGMQKTSSWVTDRLYALINRRYQECKTLILTSNLSQKALRERVEPALASRIISLCTPLEISGDDFRAHEAEGIVRTRSRPRHRSS